LLKIQQKTQLEKKVLALEDFSSLESMMYHVFLLKLHKFFKKFKDYYFIVCWDNTGSTEWRREIYPEYKSGRIYDVDPTWNVLFSGIRNLQTLLLSYPVSQESIEKLEADDVMYAYAGFLANQGEVVIASGDGDMIQAVQDFGVKLYHPVNDKYVETPKTYNHCLYKAIRGDKSDDIEGIYGYGEVKSAKLAEAIGKDSNAILQFNKEQREIVLRNLQLIEIKNNPNLNKAIPDLTKIHASGNIDLIKIQKFYFDKKLRSLLEDFDSVVSLFA
jgi:5'-3' exonuclease